MSTRMICSRTNAPNVTNVVGEIEIAIEILGGTEDADMHSQTVDVDTHSRDTKGTRDTDMHNRNAQGIEDADMYGRAEDVDLDDHQTR